MRRNSFFFRNGVLMLRRLFLSAFLVEMLIYVVVSALPLSNPALLSLIKSEQNSVDSLSFIPMFFSIFPHNLLIATLEVIPLIGQFLFIYSSVETSVVIAVEGTSIHTSGIFVFITLALLPHTWLELPSYAIAAGSSIYLIYLIARRRTLLRAKIRKVLYMYLFVVLELLVAGMFESAEIVMEQTLPAPNDILYPLLLWIPAVPVLYLLIRLFRRINRDEYGKSEDAGTGENEFSLEA
ncbi:MAG: stage II sporulation protein M [Thermoplasmataceae archaeon]